MKIFLYADSGRVHSIEVFYSINEDKKINNYIEWKRISSSIGMYNSFFKRIILNIEEILQTTFDDSDEWKFCESVCESVSTVST